MRRHRSVRGDVSTGGAVRRGLEAAARSIRQGENAEAAKAAPGAEAATVNAKQKGTRRAQGARTAGGTN
jgi:hypothetical protein